MVGKLFRRKKRPSAVPDSGETIDDARPGDVFTISGLSLDLDDSYFIIEKLNRYESAFGSWKEVLGVDGENRVWVQWSSAGGLYVTAAPERRPVGLAQLGVTEAELIRLDEEESIDNHITYDGTRYFYRNSGEALLFEDDGQQGEGFYVWDFSAEDDSGVLSVIKWEGRPFEADVSDVMTPDSITMYKR